MALAAFLLWRRRLFQLPWMLWILLLALPFSFIANTAGWFTAELGRQPKKRHTCTCEGILCKQNLDKFFVIAYKDYIDDVVSIAVVETCNKWEVDM
jgi:hypothetical protein